MSKRGMLKNISLMIALVVVVYLIANYSGLVQSTIMQLFNMPGSSVAGASTKRAQAISEKISADVTEQVAIAEEKFLNIKVSDMINGFSRLQKIPTDINALKSYSQKKIDEVFNLNSKRGN